MILIADGGSTKADWALVNKGEVVQGFQTEGFNPCLKNEDYIRNVLLADPVITSNAKHISAVYFYGSGCSEELMKQKVGKVFSEIFDNAEIDIEDDMTGAALSVCKGKPGIVCIIGTGSNAVYFDGEKLMPNNYGLGYVLADEGAGVYLGKILVTRYLYDMLPSGLKKEFERSFTVDRSLVIEKVYASKNANSWLASFASFYISHKNDAWIKDVVRQGFSEFSDLYILPLLKNHSCEVHFIGGIANEFSLLLNEVSDEKNYHIGSIIKRPIDGLARYIISTEKGH